MQRSWHRDTTKGGHTDVRPIPDALVPSLEEAIQASQGALVFPGADGQMAVPDIRLQNVLRLGYEHVCRRQGCGYALATSDAELRRCPTDGRKHWPKAKVRPIRWHDLRHTTASLLKAAGVQLVGAQRILRHSDPRITQEVYTHVDLDQLRSAVNRMPVRVGHLLKNVDGNVDGDAELETRDLEEQGLVSRFKGGRRGSPATYRLTRRAESLRSLLGAPNDWGFQIAAEVGATVEYAPHPVLRAGQSSE